MDLLGVLGAADLGGFLAINRGGQNACFDLLMPALSNKHYALLPGAVAALAFVVWGGRRALAIVLAVGVAVGLTDAGATLLKEVFQRIRPCHVVPDVHLLVGCGRSLSLPSNHAANMLAVAAVAWMTRIPGRTFLTALGVAVAYSRVYVGAHYPGDVIVGGLVGGLIGLLVSHLYLRVVANSKFLGVSPASTNQNQMH
jgi:undecaprenyl-diphosphatase